MGGCCEAAEAPNTRESDAPSQRSSLEEAAEVFLGNILPGLDRGTPKEVGRCLFNGVISQRGSVSNGRKPLPPQGSGSSADCHRLPSSQEGTADTFPAERGGDAAPFPQLSGEGPSSEHGRETGRPPSQHSRGRSPENGLNNFQRQGDSVRNGSLANSPASGRTQFPTCCGNGVRSNSQVSKQCRLASKDDGHKGSPRGQFKALRFTRQTVGGQIANAESGNGNVVANPIVIVSGPSGVAPDNCKCSGGCRFESVEV